MVNQYSTSSCRMPFSSRHVSQPEAETPVPPGYRRCPSCGQVLSQATYVRRTFLAGSVGELQHRCPCKQRLSRLSLSLLA